MDALPERSIGHRELQAKAFGANTLISADVDGNGRAGFQILLSGSVALQATDFLL